MRYTVYKRSSMIAVIDEEERKRCGNTSSGLRGDEDWVVRIWFSKQKYKVCPTCNHRSFDRWVMPQESIDEAYKLCARLNEKDCTGFVQMRMFDDVVYRGGDMLQTLSRR